MSARVLITGAAGAIGGAATAALRARGARVVGLDLVEDAGRDILACDVRDQASVDRAVAAAVERLGGLDVLINNAGIGIPQRAGEPPDDAALSVLSVNLVGPWRVTAVGLEGAVPPERLSDAARTLVRAALGPPVRDLATTRRGAVFYALVRRLPRRLVDRAAELELRRLARRGHFAGSPLAADLHARLAGNGGH